MHAAEGYNVGCRSTIFLITKCRQAAFDHKYVKGLSLTDNDFLIGRLSLVLESGHRMLAFRRTRGSQCTIASEAV